MNKVYLFALLVAVASASIAGDVSNLVLPRQTMNCFASQNVTKVIFDLLDAQGVINKNFLNNYIYAKDAGIASVDASVIVNDNFTSNFINTTVKSVLPSSFNGTVWLQVLSSDKYWNQTIDRRIAYLESLVIALKQSGFNPLQTEDIKTDIIPLELGVKVGIYSTANTWTTVFGSQGAGSDTLKNNASVWYSNDNGNQNFDDFDYAGFGTWTKPALKNYKNSAYSCYTTLHSLNYYEPEAQAQVKNLSFRRAF